MNQHVAIRKAGNRYELGSLSKARLVQAVNECRLRYATIQTHHFRSDDLPIYYVSLGTGAYGKQTAAAVQASLRCPFFDADRR